MFSVGSYLKLWEEKRRADKYVDFQCSTSRKNQEGNYETDFSSIVRFVGKAFNQVKNAQPKDSFKILQCGVTNTYDKEKKVTYTNYVVFEVEAGNNNSSGGAAKKDDGFMNIPDGIDEELPFN